MIHERQKDENITSEEKLFLEVRENNLTKMIELIEGEIEMAKEWDKNKIIAPWLFANYFTIRGSK